MFFGKRGVIYIILLVFIIFLAISVLAETAYLDWYDPGGTKCDSSTETVSGTDTYTDSAPISNSACCDVEGLVLLKVYTDYDLLHIRQENIYTVNYDTIEQSCVCRGGTWANGVSFESGISNCCGDDAGEVYETCEVEAGSSLVWSCTGSNVACCNADDCVDKDNSCKAKNSLFPNLNNGEDDNSAFCSLNSKWFDCDKATASCGAGTCGLAAGVYAGESSIGEYSGVRTDLGCCGDDTGEIYAICENEAGSSMAWSCSEKACCNAADCIDKDGLCKVKNSLFSSLNGGGNDDTAFCSSNSKWFDCDNVPASCGADVCNDIAGVYAGEPSAGEYLNTRTDLGCCGDDSNEYYTTVGIGGLTGTNLCCNSGNDCMDRQLICRDQYTTGELSCEPTDSIDDDCDGKIDCSDTNCFFDQICLDCFPEVCNNGEDDDCDHYVDCADNDCLGDANCPGCVTEICNNGVDEDCDGKEDCKDNDCIGDPACPGCTREICNNGIDDDCDGIIDQADWDCPGCTKRQSLCKDWTCSEDCETTDEGIQGCINPNDICEEGEGCACEDCHSERSSCGKYLECDPLYGICLCPQGTMSCSDGICREKCAKCGNGILESGEECDGEAFEGISSCEDVDSLTSGSMICYPPDDAQECFLDTSACTGGVPGVCGDGVVGVGETCDTINLDGKTCSTFGFSKGRLYCWEAGTEHECHFDTSGCFDEPPVESCDGDRQCGLNEDCRCDDCLGEQWQCFFGNVCDESGKCKCEDGTTLCKDETCRETCEEYPDCNDDGICNVEEGCSCPDCEDKVGPCQSSSTCVDGFCSACSILKVYWTESCIGSGVTDGVKMVIEGSEGCKGKTIDLELWEDDSGLTERTLKLCGDDDYVKSMQVVFDEDLKIEQEWTPEFYEDDELSEKGDKPNDCTIGSDATKESVNPPEKFLEYYFIAKIAGEEFQSEVLDVHYCDYSCDKDCDTFVDGGLENDCSDPAYGQFKEGSLVIDANPQSAYCENCMSQGLSPGQETCAAYYDCTPSWWGEDANYDGADDAQTARNALEWGECGEDKTSGRDVITELARQRLICPAGLTKEECCLNQGSCYCQLPDTSNPDVPDWCSYVGFKPSEVKACLAEEKFPFFTNMNIIIVILILTGFYFWNTKFETKKN